MNQLQCQAGTGPGTLPLTQPLPPPPRVRETKDLHSGHRPKRPPAGDFPSGGARLAPLASYHDKEPQPVPWASRGRRHQRVKGAQQGTQSAAQSPISAQQKRYVSTIFVPGADVAQTLPQRTQPFPGSLSSTTSRLPQPQRLPANRDQQGTAIVDGGAQTAQNPEGAQSHRALASARDKQQKSVDVPLCQCLLLGGGGGNRERSRLTESHAKGPERHPRQYKK